MSFEDIRTNADSEFNNQMRTVVIGQSKFENPIQANKISDWLKLNAFPRSLSCDYECDEYCGPQGRGFILNAFVKIEGRTYRRMENSGPEDHFTEYWQDITEEI